MVGIAVLCIPRISGSAAPAAVVVRVRMCLPVAALRPVPGGSSPALPWFCKHRTRKYRP